MKQIFLMSILLLCFNFNIHSQVIWQELEHLPSTERERTFSFVIENTLYVGTGRLNNNTNTNEIWAYNTELETWIEKGEFPGEARRNAVAFSDGEFGYVGLGYNGNSNLTDIWKYNPLTDEWSSLSDFPGGPRNWAIGLSSEGEGFIAFGGSANPSFYEKDIWRYKPLLDEWEWITDLPSSPRYRATCFLKDGKIYAGLGTQNGQLAFTDFWEYDIALDLWIQKSDFPTNNTAGCYFFQIENYFFVGEGSDGTNFSNAGNKLFQYDYEQDIWIEDSEFIGIPRVHTFGQSVNSKGYIGTGRSFLSTASFYNDLYELSLPTNNVINSSNSISIKANPNPFSEFISVEYLLQEYDSDIKLVFYDVIGNKVYYENLMESSGTVHIRADWPNGLYFLRIESRKLIGETFKVLKVK